MNLSLLDLLASPQVKIQCSGWELTKEHRKTGADRVVAVDVSCGGVLELAAYVILRVDDSLLHVHVHLPAVLVSGGTRDNSVFL